MREIFVDFRRFSLIFNKFQPIGLGWIRLGWVGPGGCLAALGWLAGLGWLSGCGGLAGLSLLVWLICMGKVDTLGWLQEELSVYVS